MDRSAKRISGSAAPSERAALDADYRTHAPWLRAMARRRIDRPDEAEDLVQETYLRVSRYPTAERAAVGPLLASILSNLIKDRFRARSRERAAHDTVAALAPLGTDADQEQQLVLKRIILGMPQPLRDVFLLARFSRLTQQQIAERLGISVKTVEWRLARALAYCVAEMAE